MRWLLVLLVLGLTAGCASIARDQGGAAPDDPAPTLKTREGRRLWLFGTALDNLGDWIVGDDRTDSQKQEDADALQAQERAATDPDQFRNIRGR